MAALNCTIDLLDSWLQKVATDKTVRQCLVKYARMMDKGSVVYITWGKGAQIEKLAHSMDRIVWQRYIE